MGAISLIGCKEADPVNISVEAAACLGGAQGTESECRTRIDALVASEPGTGCLVLEAGGSTQRVPYRWVADGEGSALEAVGAAQIPFSGGMAVEGALYLFTDQTSCSPSLTASAACADLASCAVRLIQPRITLGDTGGRLDFRQDGACQLELGPPLLADTPLGNGELCDFADNDCDGQIDEGFEIDGLAIGDSCRREEPSGCIFDGGRVACTADGRGVECVGGEANTVDVPEICDGIDNNCNGSVDENAALPCGREDGLCTQGLRACVDGRLADACLDPMGAPVVEPTAETCDGEDNDCDGVIDNGFTVEQMTPNGVEIVGVGEACTVGIGGCAGEGTVICADAQTAICDAEAGLPSAEVCNGIDDDCDGEIDVLPFEACSVGVGQCEATGRMICPMGGGAPVCSVQPNGEGAVELCTIEGEAPADEDCDGRIDEGVSDTLGDACAVGEGVCEREGEVICNAQRAVACSVEAGQPRVELCNALDDDCDGQSDEGFDFQTDVAHCGGCNVACARPNAVVSCEAGVCGLAGCRGTFQDADGDFENGCECDPNQADAPDPLFIDSNCDGVDGDAGNTRSVFVAPNGNDVTGNGSRALPFRTFWTAVQAAGTLGGRPVLLAEGTYDISIGAPADLRTHGLRMPAGVSVHGGYVVDGDTWGRRSLNDSPTPTQLVGSPVMLRYQDLATETFLDNLVVQASDAGTNQSSVGVVAQNVAGHLILQNVRIIAGNGGEGAAGADGAHGALGAAGGDDGLPDEDAMCSGCGGLGGANPACPGVTAGGGGGQGGVNMVAAADGEDGTPPRGGQAGPGAPAQSGSGSPGVAGTAGDTGNNSNAGLLQGRIEAATLIWVPRGSSSGGTATPGGGGGGGGGGGKGPAAGRSGGGGGGGGAGGCAGGAGLGATGGGGSFALHVLGGIVHLRNVELAAAEGGRGGAGGSGGVGGVGARGGVGAISGSCPACGDGGNGGPGGNGGCGGNAGGGAGGPAYAVLRVKPSGGAIAQSDITFENEQGIRLPEQPDGVLNVLRFDNGGRGGAGGDAGARDEATNRGVACGQQARSGFTGYQGAVGCCRNGPGANECGSDLNNCGG